MNYLPRLTLAALVIMAMACNRKNSQSTVPPAKLGDTLSLVLNVPLTISDEDLKLTFTDLQDSRCPENTNCIRAGEAVVSITAERPGVKQDVQLEAKGNCMEVDYRCGEDKLTLGYRLQLLNVFPYPKEGPKPKEAPVTEAMVVVMKRD